MKVINRAGTAIDFDSSVQLMNDDIREQIHAEGHDTEQAFFTRYEEEHERQTGEEWELSKANPIY